MIWIWIIVPIIFILLFGGIEKGTLMTILKKNQANTLMTKEDTDDTPNVIFPLWEAIKTGCPEKIKEYLRGLEED